MVYKTHITIAVGVNACKQGYKVRLYTVRGLVLELLEAKQNNTLEKLLKNLRSLDLLILDEWGMFLLTEKHPNFFIE